MRYSASSSGRTRRVRSTCWSCRHAAIVPEVDIEAGTLTVTPPPGLFEELVEEPDTAEGDAPAEAEPEASADAEPEASGGDDHPAE